MRKENVGAHDCAQKGITLIALVITIIVMLILVAVTISMAVNGGLFDYAGKAVGETQNEIEKEQQLADGKITVDGKVYNSIEDYIEGKEFIDWDAILADATENPDQYLQQAAEAGQDIEENTTIGIGTNGKVVNMDLWVFEDAAYTSWTNNITEGTGYSLSQSEYSEGSYYPMGYGYVGKEFDNIIIPQYINEDEEFLPVVALDDTFPEGIITVPEIPETVMFMGNSFKNCTILIEASTIPEGVLCISGTFEGCSSLKKVPEIPSSVTNMAGAFRGCTSLTGTIKINSANVTSFRRTFEGITNELTVQVPANSTTYNTLYEQYGESTNIKIETFEIEG